QNVGIDASTRPAPRERQRLLASRISCNANASGGSEVASTYLVARSRGPDRVRQTATGFRSAIEDRRAGESGSLRPLAQADVRWCAQDGTRTVARTGSL